MGLTTQKSDQKSLYNKYVHIFSTLISLLVAGFIISKWQQVLQTVLRLNIGWLVAGIGCYIANYWFRGLRLQRLSGFRLNFLNEACHFSMLHGFFSYLLPLRTGDASLPMLLKSTGKLGFKQGLGILVKTRFLDLSMLGIFTVVGAFIGARMISAKVQTIWLLTGILLALSFVAIQRIGWICNYVLKKKFDTEIDLSSELKIHLCELWMTFFVWVGMYGSQFCMVRAIGLDLTLAEIIFISAIQFPLQLLPVQGLANTGNHEGGWVSAMVLMGFTPDISLDYALISHGVLMVYVGVLGLVAFMTGCRRGKVEKSL